MCTPRQATKTPPAECVPAFVAGGCECERRPQAAQHADLGDAVCAAAQAAPGRAARCRQHTVDQFVDSALELECIESCAVVEDHHAACDRVRLKFLDAFDTAQLRLELLDPVVVAQGQIPDPHPTG